VGSGYSDFVPVQTGKVTDAFIKVRPVEISLNVPDVIYLDKVGEYTFTGDVSNPLLELSPGDFIGYDEIGPRQPGKRGK
jgi:hypothetical protein